MSRRESNRWNTQFGDFVLNYGVTHLATELEIQPGAIYQWVRGITTPRPAYAAAVRDLAHESGFRLSLDEIYGHRSSVLAADPGCITQVPREQHLACLRAARLHCKGG